MAATTVNGTQIADIVASPIVPIDRRVFDHYGKSSIMGVDVATTSTDETADVILVTLVPSDCIIDGVYLKSDDLDTNACPTLAVDIGVYYSGIGGTQAFDGNTIGTEIDVDLFASADITLQSATLTWTEITNEAQNIDNYDVELWSAAGLSADPGGYFLIGTKVTTVSATPVAGGLVIKADYRA